MEISTISSLQATLHHSLTFANNVPTLHNKRLLQEKDIDTLTHEAVFAVEKDVREFARSCIRTLAKSLGIVSTSIAPLYTAIGKDAVKERFTVPAFNIRALTYDTARIIFRLTKEKALGPYIFEIARSEIEYTAQEPDEYAVVILAAAIKEGYTGPVFLQGDHYQLSARRFKENQEEEINKIRTLIDTSLAAGFRNIDIDASTLVNLEKTSRNEQQKNNYEVTAHLTTFIREKEEEGPATSIGAEIGHIGGKNSTPEELRAFMDGYLPLLPSGMDGIRKISVQTGTSHGGIPLPDGTMAAVNIDFSVLRTTGETARRDYGLGGVVQHGASTLPNDLFGHFPQNRTLEIHLATGFQNIIYDNMPTALRENMYEWVATSLQKEWEDGWTKEQFLYKTRKKALGPFKKALWSLPHEEKAPMLLALEEQFSLLFEKLGVMDTRHIITTYVT